MGYRPKSEGGGGLAARLRRVRDSGDRKAAAGLVELLRGAELDIPALDAVCTTLTALEDLRVVPDLEALLLDRSQRPARREAALEILAGLPREDPPPERVSEWIRGPDPVLRACGATFLGAPDGARLARLLRDPQSVVRRSAARSLVGLARTPELVDATCRALHDPDPIVREWACQAAYVDEPLPALFDVLRLLGDEDDGVRRSAFDAAGEFPCVSAVLALADAHQLPDGPSEPSEEQRDAADCADEILCELLYRIARSLATWGRAEARLTRWIGPARWVLDEYARRFDSWTFEEAGPPAAERDRHARPPVDLPTASVVLLDPDAPARAQRDALSACDWVATGAVGLALLTAAEPILSGYRTRRALTQALSDLARAGATGARHRLLELARDDDTAVRHAALSMLVAADDEEVVGAALETLATPAHRGLAGDTAVAAIATLAPRSVAEGVLLAELERRDDAAGLLLGVVHQVERLGLASAAGPLAAIVASPVAGSVGPHVTALRTLRSLGCERLPAVSHLVDVDHLHVQRELGVWGVREGRFA